MLRLLQSFGKNLARAAELPFRSDAAALVPDEVPMEPEDHPHADENPAALEARVLNILRVASRIPPGPQRRDALAADLRAQLAATQPAPTASDTTK